MLCQRQSCGGFQAALMEPDPGRNVLYGIQPGVLKILMVQRAENARLDESGCENGCKIF